MAPLRAPYCTVRSRSREGERLEHTGSSANTSRSWRSPRPCRRGPPHQNMVNRFAATPQPSRPALQMKVALSLRTSEWHESRGKERVAWLGGETADEAPLERLRPGSLGAAS